MPFNYESLGIGYSGLNFINKTFFNVENSQDTKQKIKNEISDIKRRLIKLQNDLARFDEVNIQGISKYSYLGLQKNFPWLRIDGSSNGIAVYSKYQPIFFHGNRMAKGESNDRIITNREIIYVSEPLYGFTAELSMNGNITMFQNEALVYDNRNDSLVHEDRGICHPHAYLDTYGKFAAVCQGNNQFISMWKNVCRSGINASDLVMVIRKIALWFMEANLSDMYGSSPCGTLEFPDEAQWLNTRACFQKSTDLLRILQTEEAMDATMRKFFTSAECYMDSEDDTFARSFFALLASTSKFFEDSRRRVQVSAYTFIYSLLWSVVLHGWYTSYGIEGLMSRQCLIDVIRNDIFAKTWYIRNNSGIDIYSSKSEMMRILASPVAMLNYGSAWGINASALDGLKDALGKETGWLMARKEEIDTVW